MGIKKSDKIWFNGKFINWDDAKIHILSHVISYGTAMFEGERCYNTEKGPAVFRLHDHTDRFFNSCKIYRMEVPFSKEEFNKASLETIRINKMKECYIRPIALRGYGSIGVDPFPCPIDVYIAVWEWGKYLGEDALEKGVDVRVSSWTRMAPNTFPALAKCAANYMNSQLIKMEALVDGYIEGISLDISGYVSEGSGENIFIVRHGKLLTPPLSSCILPGITRETIITIAHDLGYEVITRNIPREELYIADEVFFTGTAVEVTPIRSVDRIVIGEGKIGPITKQLQSEYLALVKGEKPDKYGWLTYL